MPRQDPRVDAYIERAGAFAQPILKRLREAVHAVDPTVEESIKWGMPSFSVDGRILCNMAAFKQHCAFNIWHGKQLLGESSDAAMGQFGRLMSVDDLPSARTLTSHLKKALKLRRETPAAPSPRRAPRAEAEVPAALAAALKKHAKARATFDAFPPSHRREYIEWIEEARREDTRARRVATTIEWLAEGKPRNWKYMKS